MGYVVHYPHNIYICKFNKRTKNFIIDCGLENASIFLQKNYFIKFINSTNEWGSGGWEEYVKIFKCEIISYNEAIIKNVVE